MTLGAMVTLGNLEHTLPHEKRLRLSLTYGAPLAPSPEYVRTRMRALGFRVLDWSVEFCKAVEEVRYELLLKTNGERRQDELADALSHSGEVMRFHLDYARA